jgi:glycine/D-amino acid oxidase-like deaminating enzyme
MSQRIQTVIIGAGTAGLSSSHYLTQQQRENLVIEQGRIAETSRTRRWDCVTAAPGPLLRRAALAARAQVCLLFGASKDAAHAVSTIADDTQSAGGWSEELRDHP